MTITSIEEAATDLAGVCDRVVEDREPVLVRRASGEGVVIVAAREFDQLAETAHLLASSENAARLLAALAAARRGGTPPIGLEDLRAAVGL